MPPALTMTPWILRLAPVLAPPVGVVARRVVLDEVGLRPAQRPAVPRFVAHRFLRLLDRWPSLAEAHGRPRAAIRRFPRCGRRRNRATSTMRKRWPRRLPRRRADPSRPSHWRGTHSSGAAATQSGGRRLRTGEMHAGQSAHIHRRRRRRPRSPRRFRRQGLRAGRRHHQVRRRGARPAHDRPAQVDPGRRQLGDHRDLRQAGRPAALAVPGHARRARPAPRHQLDAARTTPRPGPSSSARASSSTRATAR